LIVIKNSQKTLDCTKNLNLDHAQPICKILSESFSKFLNCPIRPAGSHGDRYLVP